MQARLWLEWDSTNLKPGSSFWNRGKPARPLAPVELQKWRQFMGDADRFAIALSQVAHKRLTYAELTGKTADAASTTPEPFYPYRKKHGPKKV